ncbi:MAG TPA: CvpA family protein [Desulfovibrio sp.]|jgi:membrane protein required for colicin V production|uniref:CvpA family protein n=1 Tax=Desulfovibrio TaxID=872 RepID=UPI0003FB2F05|nr:MULTISPECIES: CvpA family protein [Desulfovibrio]MDY0306672.1 CvpA family protein [Desulfovibrionaceae bacterium]HMM37921.1 CvpA family protein [Desulfovibrio sp.]
MNFLDVTIVAILILAVIRGLAKGFVREAVSLGSLGIATLTASRYHGVLAPHLAVYMKNGATIAATSYLLTFLATLVGCWLAALFLRNLLKVTLLGWLDHTAGAVLGFAEGCLVSLVMLLLLNTFLPGMETVRHSLLAPRADPALRALADMAPSNWRKTLEERGITLPKQPPSLREILEKNGMPVQGADTAP